MQAKPSIYMYTETLKVLVSWVSYLRLWMLDFPYTIHHHHLHHLHQQLHPLFLWSSRSIWATKTTLTFHYTGYLIGILWDPYSMVYEIIPTQLGSISSQTNTLITKQPQRPFFHSHRIYVWYIYLHECLILMGFHVGKYTIVPWKFVMGSLFHRPRNLDLPIRKKSSNRCSLKDPVFPTPPPIGEVLFFPMVVMGKTVGKICYICRSSGLGIHIK